MKAVLRGLTENEASTDPQSVDLRLRGRTYAIPFEVVWQASLKLTDRGMLGWTLGRANDQTGIIMALARTPLTGSETDIRIRVGLDANAQTRVDLVSSSRTERGDFGRSKRHIARFLRKLDKELDAKGKIFDPIELERYVGNA